MHWFQNHNDFFQEFAKGIMFQRIVKSSGWNRHQKVRKPLGKTKFPDICFPPLTNPWNWNINNYCVILIVIVSLVSPLIHIASQVIERQFTFLSLYFSIPALFYPCTFLSLHFSLPALFSPGTFLSLPSPIRSAYNYY